MIITRKKFLQVTGISVLAVAGEKLAATFAATMQTTQPALPQPITASRWAMTIDLNKCAEKEGCPQCIEACHSVLTGFSGFGRLLSKMPSLPPKINTRPQP
jgi:hypothetical protein